MTYSSKTPCPDRVLPSTTVWFLQRETKQSLHTPHSTLHTALFALQTSNFTLHTSHFTLLTTHCFLHTPNLTLHTSHCALRTPHLNFTLHHYNAICRDWVAKHNRTTHNGVGNCGSKTRCQSEKKTILKHFLKGFLEGKSLAPKWRKSTDKSVSQPSCSHSNTI